MKTRIFLALSFFISACNGAPPLPTLALTADPRLNTPRRESATQRLITPTRESATPIPNTVAAQVTQSAAQSPTSSAPLSVIDLYVDAAKGDDARTGATRDAALRTVTEAWNRIPKSKTLTQGYRIRLLPGVYAASDVPNYWEMRYGTERAPVILQGEGEVKLPPINMFDVRWFYLIGVQVEGGGGDVLHCEKCDHLFVQRSKIVGLGDVTKHDAPQETIKVNQSQYVTIEDSDVSGGFDNAIDFVAVQHGVIRRNKIHRAGDWCAYAKGGSAYIRVEANEIYDCGTGGFTAGQGTGFEFMVPDWLKHEAYDVKVINNVIHDTQGAGVGVNGGYNILIAHNTMFRVGKISHVLEVVFGSRSCDGDVKRCAENLSKGGWGTSQTGGDGEPIPDRNVFIYNNVIYNPAGYQSQWQHLAIYGGRKPSPDSNIPSPALADVNLQIRGNVIWNGPKDHPLGIEDGDQGCQPANPTCNATQLRADNAINTLQPQFADFSKSDLRPAGNLLTAKTFSLPPFVWDQNVPAGDLNNEVKVDRDGQARTSVVAGAYTK